MTHRRGFAKRSSSGSELVYPAVDFPLYAPAQARSRARWVENIKARTGQWTWAVWLGQDDDAGGKLLVGTLPRQRFTQAMGALLDTIEEAVADEAVTVLANNTRDAVNAPEIAPATTQQREWRGRTWAVDDEAVSAQVWQHGPVWAGMAELADAYVVAAAVDVSPDLTLATVNDTASFGPALAHPINVNAVGHSTRRRMP